MAETNKVEITATHKVGKYISICCMLIILGIVLGIVLLLNSMGSFGAALAAALLAIFFIPVVLCGLIYVLWYYRKAGQPCTFSISDQEITIMIPTKPSFQISWSDFDTIQIFKIYIGISTNRRGYSLNFISNDGSQRNFDIELVRDFKKGKAKKIRSLLEQYANRLNKEYIWGTKRKKK